MSFTDPIADMITRIRNAQLRKLNTVSIPNSKFRARILDVLKGEGYISDYKFLSDSKNKGTLVVDLKYYNGIPVIKKIKRISKPGIRVYSKISELQKSYGGLGISIISTPKGVMSDQKARDNNVGGEILCEVF